MLARGSATASGCRTGSRNSFSSSILARMRRSCSALTSDEDPRSASPKYPGPVGVDGAEQLGHPAATAPRSGAMARAAGPRCACSMTVAAHSGQQPHHRAHLEPRGAAVGEAQHVVEEAVLLVPHPVRRRAGPSPRRSRGSARRTSRPCPRRIGSSAASSTAMLQHVLAEERHPRRAVGLLEVPAGRQRRAAVEDADVVEPEEAALEDVLAEAVLAVHPPGEVEQQLVEGRSRKSMSVVPAQRPSRCCAGSRVAKACTGGLTSPKFHS